MIAQLRCKTYTECLEKYINLFLHIRFDLVTKAYLLPWDCSGFSLLTWRTISRYQAVLTTNPCFHHHLRISFSLPQKWHQPSQRMSSHQTKYCIFWRILVWSISSALEKAFETSGFAVSTFLQSGTDIANSQHGIVRVSCSIEVWCYE